MCRRSRRVHLARRRLDGHAGGAQRPRRPDQRLRGPPRQLAAARRRSDPLADVRRSRTRARPLLRRDGVHARRVAPPHRAPVVGELGLPDDRHVRRHEPVRAAAGADVARRRLPPRRDRGDRRLGAGPLPQGQPRSAALRRHGPLRTRGSAPGGASRLGNDDLQLRPPRGPQLPRLQRPVLARPLPHRRPPGRCRGLDALSRLQPEGRGMAP